MAIWSILEPGAIAPAYNPLVFRVQILEPGYTVMKAWAGIYVRETPSSALTLVAIKVEDIEDDYYQFDISNIIQAFLSYDLPGDSGANAVAVTQLDNSSVEYQVKFKGLIEEDGVVVESGEYLTPIKVAINATIPDGDDLMDYTIIGQIRGTNALARAAVVYRKTTGNEAVSGDEELYTSEGQDIYVRNFDDSFDFSFR